MNGRIINIEKNMIKKKEYYNNLLWNLQEKHWTQFLKK